MRKSIVTILAGLSASLAVPAAAADEVSVTISYADLDLTAAEGTAALERRIDAAVDKVCVRPEMRSLKAMSQWQACKTAALTDAMEQRSALEPFETMALASVF